MRLCEDEEHVVRSLPLLFLIVLVAGLSAPAPAGARAIAFVRLVHAVPNAPAMTLYANGTPQGDALKFAEVGAYRSLPAGSYRFQLALAGGKTGAPPQTEVTIAAGAYHTIAAVGIAPYIEPVALVDAYRAPAQGNAGVRVYHLSPDAPAIDLLQNGDRIVYNLPFPAASQVVDASADRNQRDLHILPSTVSKPVLVTFDSASLRADMVNDVFILNELANIEVRVVPNTMLVAVPAELPRTGTAGEPFAWIVLALLLLACGVAVRRRML